MSDAPVYDIDPAAFWRDPYPDLARMRADTPICFVPQLGATLLTRHQDIFVNEKRIEIFSSHQPAGLMTTLMGENLMRKDGEAHQAERKAIFPSVSLRTVRAVWRAQFEQDAAMLLDDLRTRDQGDLVQEFALLLSAHALRAITGLTNMLPQEMNRVSQGMIDGCANYAGDPAVEANCHDCTASIDRHIDMMIPVLRERPDSSLLSVQLEAGLSEAQIRANIKLAISGGQNEPRDAIAGTVWALLTHPEQLAQIRCGQASWQQAFEEYARWMSPIGMSPRRIACPFEFGGVRFEPEDRVFLMFGSGNRDEAVYPQADRFNLGRAQGASLAFGAGPHFCAGAWASRTLIGEVALPRLFEALDELALEPGHPAEFGGWAFRGPLHLHCRWRA